MRLIDLKTCSSSDWDLAAELLVSGFAKHWPNAWPTLDSAKTEVRKMLQNDRLAIAAITENDRLAGWIGGIPKYDGHVMELHPLVVDPKNQGKEIGTALVSELEKRAATLGFITVMLGTDDEDFMTSLGGTDLYDDLPQKINDIKNLNHHPYEFYQKIGYTIVGVLPDANGPGKPDIYMAKRIV